MNPRQKIIMSITGIFIVLLALLGITYAYFLTRIKENENEKSIYVTTANLMLEYGGDDGSIIGENETITPGTTFDAKTFTVTNIGNQVVENYAVILENVKTYYNEEFEDENGNKIQSGTQVAFKRPEDFKLSIACKITDSPNTDRINSECIEPINSNLPLEKSETLNETYIVNGILLTNRIEKGETHEYTVILTYNEAKTNQSADMNKVLEGKLNIIDARGTIDLKGTVTGYTEGDLVETNSVPRRSQINSDGSYKIVGLEADIHKVKVVNGDTKREVSKISILKGEEAKVSTTFIGDKEVPEYNITDTSRTAILDIDLGENKVIPGEIEDYNPFNKGTLAYNIYKNGAQVLNTTTNELEIDKSYEEKLEITKAANGTDMSDVGIFTAPDDYGTSYYYRGTVKNNYVNFAGFTWRIVRINGDGSVRLTLEGTLDKVCAVYNTDGSCKTKAGTTSVYNSLKDNNAYIGYMYGLALETDTELSSEEYEIDRCLKLENDEVTDKIADFPTQELCEYNGGKWTKNAYEATHANVKDSKVKTNVDKFYENYIMEYEGYLADSIFCNDKSLTDISYGSNNTALGYGRNTTYYAATQRIYMNSNGIYLSKSKPTFKCAEGEKNNYSRLTSNLDTENYLPNGVNINNDLKYPIALLSGDEYVYAGGWRQTTNKTYYLFNNLLNVYYWLSSPHKFTTSAAVFESVPYNYSLMINSVYAGYAIRPVINLRADTYIKSGNGTSDSMYEIKEI